MKLIALLYLEDDEAAVARLLKEHDVIAYSRLSLEGHGGGARGWYGEVAPYASSMAFTLVPEEKADELLQAVRDCHDVSDPNHPIHALKVAVEEIADSGSAST
jgi:hypothetical protein